MQAILNRNPVLAEAVKNTAKKLLPQARFEKCFHCRTDLAKLAYDTFKSLGYADQKWEQRTRKYGGWRKIAHPQAIEYFRTLGEPYLLCLRAALHPHLDTEAAEKRIEAIYLRKAKDRLLNN
jgi:hypothetical protein